MTALEQSAVCACTITVGKSAYFMRDRVEHVLVDIQPITATITPAVVIHADTSNAISAAHVIKALSKFETFDDVYTNEFAVEGSLILVYDTTEPPDLEDALVTYAQAAFAEKLILYKTKDKSDWLEGPYFLKGNDLHQAWLLYPDDLEAFVSSIVPSKSSPYKFETLRAMAYDGLHSAVAVPSRLYFPPSPEKPLNGKRIAVKDNYHISGTVTTLGNRSYARFYGIKNVTSTYAKRLIDQGAVIVGKTKLSSFAGTEGPPNGAIDYLPSFNPRADGYQKPHGSSIGSSTAVAGYEWLDYSLATDTTGSTRAPAAANGIWALRSTWEESGMEDVVPSAQPFDAIGLFSRSPDGLLSLLPNQPSNKNTPTTLLYPTDWLPVGNESQQIIIDAFVSNLESQLGITRRNISLSKEWEKTAPDEVRAIPLADYLKKTGWLVNMWGSYHNFANFREQYQQKFKKPPYISPVQKWKWFDGSTVTPELRENAEKQIVIFKNWVSKYIIGDDSSSIMIVPSGNPKPDYRDEGSPNPTGGSTPGGSYNPTFVPTMLGLPHLVVPVGQLPFESRISEKTEYLPVTVGLVGTAGSDDILIRVARDSMQKAGWPTVVQTGSLAFELGDNIRNAVVGNPETSKL